MTRRQLFAAASGRLRLGPAYVPVEDRITRGAAACCRACYSTDRHAAIPWEQWRRRQRTRDSEPTRPTAREGVTP